MSLKYEDNKKINASPTKSFFVDTLVKDIRLIDALLELIDNSIDGYLINRFQDRKKISIHFSKDEFVMEDYCGGIKKEEIYEHVFRLGIPKKSKEKNIGVKTIGVYGIGLKRAIFKIGQNILIESDDGENYYSVRIDKTWLEDDENWVLGFETEDNSKGVPLTRITIKDIFPHIAEEMINTVFINQFRERIKDVHSIFIEDRITIEVNGIPVDPYDFKFLYNVDENFVPFHKKYKFDGVDAEIYAGYTTVDRTERNPYGWYVFCNDRLVVRNDTSERTGWGIGERKYHYPEDNRFLGLIFFRSDDSLSLPWDSTKTDIQDDSKIYRSAQVEMRAITTRLIDVIHLAGRIDDPETGEKIGKALFENVSTRLRKDLAEESEEIVPAIKDDQIIEENPPGQVSYVRLLNIPQVTTIQYTKKKTIVKNVKKKLGNAYMPNKEAGEKTFDYYVKMEEIKDE